METLSQMLARNSRIIPDRDFIVTDAETITYRDFHERTGRLAHVLTDHGVCKGDRVGLYLPSTPMMAVGFWACQRLGAIPAPVSAMFRHAELKHTVEQTGMTAMIADASTYPYLAEVRSDFDTLAHCFVAGGKASGDGDLDALMNAASPHFEDIECGLHDTAALFFTSGTTGAPKGTAQTHFNQCSTLRDMMTAHRTRFASEIYLCAVPLFTNFGLTVTLNLCLYTGGTIILHERWDTQKVLADIGRHGATYFGGTPTMYVYLVNDYDAARHDLSSLRLCITGGAPVPQPVIRRFEDYSGVRVAQVYGSTETCGQNVIEPVIGVRKPGAAGVAVGSSRITIVGEDGTERPVGEIGEVIIGGDCVAQGYYANDAATAKVFTEQGWKSGDLGYLDEDGFLFIVDRKKDVIIAGGHNIYPLEVESVLYRHPSVAMCAIVGVPDPVKGEIPVAVVVPSDGAKLTEDDIRLWCREHLAAYKAPRRVEFIDNMPVEAAKIRKRELVEALTQGRLDRFRKP